MALFESNGLEDTRMIAGGGTQGLAIRTFGKDTTSCVILPYDEIERLRDYLNDHLIKYWPQEEDTDA